MRKALLAVGLAAGMGMAAHAAVLVLNPGDSGFVGTVTGSGSGFVSYDGTTTFGAMFDFGGATYGYIVDDSTGKVVAEMVDAAPVHFGNVVGLQNDGVEDGVILYYLATSDTDLAVGDAIAGISYQSESFELVPEPSTYALLAGLGLLGFAGYRRFRG